MAGNPHPASVAFGAGDVSKAAVIADDKMKNRRVADADEIRNGNWAGQFGLLFVASLNAWFKVDTSDTTSADDGTSIIVDANGLRFKRVSTGAATPRVETGNGDISLTSSDTIVILDPGTPSAREVELPSDATGAITVMDGGGNWETNNTTFVVAGSGTINGAASWIGRTNYGGFDFIPIGDGNYLARGIG